MYSINFLYTAQVILNHVPSVLRKVFLKKVGSVYHGEMDPSNFGKWLQSKQVKHKYSKQQKTLDNGNVKEWDTTLLCHLLLEEKTLTSLNNGAPLIGQKVSKEYKAVHKLREIRNEHFAHLSKAEVPEDVLKKLIEDVKRLYTDLEGHGFDTNDFISLDEILRR